VNRPGKHAGISVKGALDTGAQVSLAGEFGLFDPEFFVDHQLQVTELDIAHLSPYLEPHLGTAIAGGKLAVVVHYRQEKGRIVAENHLEVSDIRLGEKKKKHTNTELTVALLLQPDGRMVFDVPVSGNTADANFSLRASIVKKLSALQVKASVSPFLLVDDILKETKLPAAERRQLSYLSFVAGKSDFSRSGKEKLAALAHLLRERPWLTLKIQGFADAGNDRTAMIADLKENALYRQVVEEIRKSDEISKAYGREEILPPVPLAKLGKQQDMVRKKTGKVTVDDAELLELALQRSMAVQGYLVEELGVEKSRISVKERQTIIKETAGRSGNRVDFIVGSSLERTARGE
jgi:outer membrane protein OmpA-like peptidoglycan-associated protein